MRFRMRLIALIILLPLVLAGCSGRVTNQSQVEDFNLDTMLGWPWAIGGVVLNPRLDPDRVAQKELHSLADPWHAVSDEYSPLLYGGFVERAPQMELWTFASVFGQVPEPALKALQDGFARSQILGASDFSPISSAMPRIRYLVLGRIDGTEIDTYQDAATKEEDQRVKDGRNPHGGSLNRSLTVRRIVNMTMQVYDLRDGQMMWSGSVERWKNELFTGAEVDKAMDIRVTKGSEEGRDTEISIEGTPLRTPSLAAVVDAACSALARELIPE